MNNSHSEAYAAAGVDITAGYKSVELMKKHIRRTETPGVCSGVGGFGGLFRPDLTGMKEPVLVSGTDGVGTKLKIALLMDKHDTIGIDCVAMCVNDIICCGAEPLFFLDYIACGKNIPERIEQIVKGVCDGCVQAGCALIGGETAEHPGMMPEEEYDLAGYSTGVVDRAKIIDNKTMKAGDVVIALPSTGVHSNGFSLVRKVFDVENADLKAPVEKLGGKSLGETLLTPTKIYVNPFRHVLSAGNIVQEEQGLRAAADDIVDAHGHTVDTDGVMPVHQLRDLQLGAYAVGAGYQHRLLHPGQVRPEQSAESAHIRADTGDLCPLDMLFHQLD